MAENKKENYHILSLIGQGAYGHVYKARRKMTGQFVAIKSIKKKGKEEKDIKVMRDEIQILKKLKHQNIILLLDSFQTNSQFILVTELGQGELFNIIQDDQSLQEPEIRKIAQQLVRALHYIHSNRITHRDMKPQNILMTSDGVIKLCDFGFARHMSYKTEVLTSLKGTPLYMAPEVVKQEPYNHTADLWSLGVILYQLSTGTPPFTAPNLITLVQHISKDPIVYPENITGDFKNFLKGLLNKDPKKRLGWPELLSHPFIKETQAQKLQRKRKIQQFSNWVEQNHYVNQEQERATMMGGTIYARSISQNGFEDKSRDISPKKQGVACNDSVWNKYLAMVGQQKGANALRTDSGFLDNLLKILQTNLNQILRVKQKRSVLCTALKVLIQVMMKSKPPQNKKFDNSKNLNIPNHLLNILKGLLKVEGGKQFLQIISDIIKIIGLLARSSFHKNFGIQMVYVRSLIPLLPQMVKTAVGGNDPAYQNLTINLLRTTGIFANNASANHIRSFSFYKDLVEKRFIQQCMYITKNYFDNLNVLKLFVQVLSAFMHPVYGDIQCFPWKRDSSPGVQEYKECATMLECVRQTIINSLLESDCGGLFEKILTLEDDGALLPKISVCRITLQAIRQSKQFTEYILFQEKNLVKQFFEGLNNPDPAVYGTVAQIISQLLRALREKKKQKHLDGYINNVLPVLMVKLKDTKNPLNIFGSLLVLQELLVVEGNTLFTRIIQEIQGDKSYFKAMTELISNSQVNKLQQMRKIQGSNYGIHPVGFYDPVFLFMHRLLVRIQKEMPKKLQDFLRLIKQSKMQAKIAQIVCGLNSKCDFSPRGLISLLMLLYDLLCAAIWDEFAEQNFLGALVNLLSEQQVQALSQWPLGMGGGEVCITTMFGNLMKIFLVYLQQAEKEPEIVKIIFQQKLIELVISFAKHLNQDTISSVVTFILHLLAFDKSESKQRDTRSFVRQFIQANGMSLFVRFQLLKSQQSAASLIQSCNLLSQIARYSKQVYQFIDSIQPYEDLSRLIAHPDAQVRSRILNLIGNMCRHSGFFYKKLNSSGILKNCISLCQDEDKTIKKFACVAIGNASFHDDTLYESLKPAIPILVNLLKDTEEKTRSNAAAALGNLARNSALLDKQFVSTGANYQLVNMLSQDKSTAAKKVSIMAIINLLELPESKKVLMGLDVGKILQKMLLPPLNSDSGLVKTAQKALDKLK